MTTVRLTLEYDGTGFRGWARQPGERTVEGVLREALDAVVPRWSGLAVAGRTDTGVHASGQVASLKADGGPPVKRLAEALSTALPHDVAVVGAELAPDGFHARYSATARSYRYVVLTARHRSPLRARRALWWPRPPDEAALHTSAAMLAGEHDFTAFTPSETLHDMFRRTILAAAWERRDDELHFTITANSFLRHMVRILVGTMIEEEPASFERLLQGRPRAEAGLTAPAWGLCLEHVRYGTDPYRDV